MKSRLDETSQRLLVIFKLDARRLFERVKYRAPEYLTIFSLKRTREHFKEVFYSRYETCTVHELLHCSEDVLVGLDQFYSSVESLRWYLGHTEDMPAKVEDKVYAQLREIEVLYETLGLYLNAELGVSEPVEVSLDDLTHSTGEGSSLDFGDESSSEENLSETEFGSETQWDEGDSESNAS